MTVLLLWLKIPNARSRSQGVAAQFQYRVMRRGLRENLCSLISKENLENGFTVDDKNKVPSSFKASELRTQGGTCVGQINPQFEVRCIITGLSAMLTLNPCGHGKIGAP